MKTSIVGVQAIMHREGFETVGYLDSRGIPTNGVGHAATGGPPPVWVGQVWSTAQVMAVLALDLEKYEAGVAATIKRPMGQNQFDAFVSFALNIGTGGFHGSHAAFLFNAGDVQGCADAFLAWEHPPELKGRREGERAQFLRPDDPSLTAPAAAPPSAPLMSISEIGPMPF
jgi:lysozyme